MTLTFTAAQPPAFAAFPEQDYGLIREDGFAINDFVDRGEDSQSGDRPLI
jgi:hypothetical protein